MSQDWRHIVCILSSETGCPETTPVPEALLPVPNGLGSASIDRSVPYAVLPTQTIPGSHSTNVSNIMTPIMLLRLVEEGWLSLHRRLLSVFGAGVPPRQLKPSPLPQLLSFLAERLVPEYVLACVCAHSTLVTPFPTSEFPHQFGPGTPYRTVEVETAHSFVCYALTVLYICDPTRGTLRTHQT